MAVVLVEIAVDGGLEVDQGTKGAPPGPPPRERGEEGLDGVGPRAGGWREVKGPAGVAGEPGADLRMLVAAVIVENGVDTSLLAGTAASTRLRKRMFSFTTRTSSLMPTGRLLRHALSR